MERLVYSTLTLSASSAAVAGAAAPHPYTWLAPVGVGCLAALIVRGITVTTPSKKKRIWVFELLVTMLSVLLTGVIVHDRSMSISAAAFLGVGVGGLGVGVISIARTAVGSFVRNLAKSVLGAVDDKAT
jgi:hypothetical protein